MNSALKGLFASLLIGTFSTASAQDAPTPFHEDFTNNPFLRSISLENIQTATPIVTSDSGAIIDISGSASTGDDSTRVGIRRTDSTLTAVSTRFVYDSLSSENDDGNSRMRLTLNMTSEEGNTEIAPTDRVEFNLSIRLNSDSTIDTVICAGSHTQDDTTNIIVTDIDNGDGCAGFGTLFDFDTAYEVAMGVDVDNNSFYVDVDGERSEYPVLISLAQLTTQDTRIDVISDKEGTRTRVELLEIDGETDLSYLSDTTVDFSNGPSDFASNPDSSMSVENGALSIFSRSTTSNGVNRTNLSFSEHSDYIEADISIDSSTVVAEDGNSSASVNVAGTFYNDLQDGGENGEEGDHFALVGLVKPSVGNLYAEACLLRSDASDYSEITYVSLGNGDGVCEIFSTVVNTDTFYNSRINFDKETSTLTFGFEDEEISYIVNGATFEPSFDVKSVRVVAFGLTDAAGNIDNVSNTSDATEIPETTEPTETPDSTDSTDSTVDDNDGGSSGCSISSEGSEPVFLFLVIFSIITLLYRRGRTKSIQ